MPERFAGAWLPAAAYLYVLHLDGPSLAWEYLRRNPRYRRDWQLRRRRFGAPQHRWGLQLYENPDCDALLAQPDWLLDPDSVIPLQPAEASADPSERFTLWHIPGRKRLLHDARRLLLASLIGGQVVRIAIAPDVTEGAPYVYAVRPGSQAPRRWRAIEEQLAKLEAAAWSAVSPRPSRLGLVHMRSLQALDGVLAGASHREVARALFGESDVARRWHDDGELRAQVRHLIRRGRAFMDGRYRHLLYPPETSPSR